MKPTVIALIAALVSGSAMYTVGARTSDNTAPVAAAALAEPVGEPAVGGVSTVPSLRPVAVAPTRTVSRTSIRPVTAGQSSVVRDEAKPQRSWKKTALIIGGSAAGGAGVGAVVGGKKGAITGAAIGGGAASIYEAIKRN